jgi:hypothetical protein
MARTFGGATPQVASAQAKLRDPQIDRAMTAELHFPGGHTGRVRCSMWSSDLLQFSAKVVGDRGELRCSIQWCRSSSIGSRFVRATANEWSVSRAAPLRVSAR